ncbi:indolepyruvate ferredoxin oxidoreductase family protein [Ralstonia insidiosa]|uniref:indolepyruvate ferredoxin oxidoreductase family protein n=1 Tax=Ralstonia insidiosa TaxID=190721 RepID=UPI003211BFD6
MQLTTAQDKYTAHTGRVFLSGIDALVRLMVVQRLRDRAAGLNTAGFVSGYRGSPLGGLDQAFWKASDALAAHDIRFQPGVNEDLAATAVWGTQQVHLLGESKHDGVFALWYAKGPGVDRSGDVLKHLNHAGTSAHGGVLLVAGDDHGAYSSTLPHQSDHLFCSAMIPVLYPADVQEYIELGLHGWAMSRYSGCAVGFKALADTVESSAGIDADPFALQIHLPTDHVLPEGGLNCRLSSDPLGLTARKQEALMQDHKLPAVLAYARANRLNRTTHDAPTARLGIVASGKSYRDVREALALLEIDADAPEMASLRLHKVAMPWPLEPLGICDFATGLDEILVIEEKRPVVESQLRQFLYDLPDNARPRIVGKSDGVGELAGPAGNGVFSAKTDLSVAQIAMVIADRLTQFHPQGRLAKTAAWLRDRQAFLDREVATPARSAYYCSGCPHSTSTKVPEGSLALGGIGCHIMATAIYPEHNKTFTQMGGEGATWIGQAPFSQVPHVFANLGDGTYFHSGYLAIRAAIAAKVNITYKLLYNDAVAMTGGQPVDGTVTVQAIARQLASEGVTRIALVSEDPSRHDGRSGLPDGVTIHPRESLDAVQRELRKVQGTSVLIYEQVCAAEKRRRKKKQAVQAPARHLFINPLVCEGCGDCATQSNCSSIVPLETEFGRKRAVHQGSCNQDTSCAKGFCPSFVTVEGGRLRGSGRKQQKAALPDNLPALPTPQRAALDAPFNVLICGIGGTGVITVGTILGMAAYLEGKGASVLDMTGMSQKNGAVMSHVRIAQRQDALHSQRIPACQADVVLGYDILTAAARDAVDKIKPGHTQIVLNTEETPPGHAIRQVDWQFPTEQLRRLLGETAEAKLEFVDAGALAQHHLGDALYTNLLMLGYAFQRGLLPLSEASILRAIEHNGVAVQANQRAFQWGRYAAFDAGIGASKPLAESIIKLQKPASLDAVLAHRRDFLTAYQNEAYARRYVNFVEHVRQAERAATGKQTLATAVAHNLFKLMAYKDEYEVARLFSGEDFRRALAETFEGDVTLRFHLAPPILSALEGGTPRKRTFGPGTQRLFAVLARFKWLRGTRFDPFGYTHERRQERALIVEYEQAVDIALGKLNALTYDAVLQLANLPKQIRGYGHVKAACIESARTRQHALLAQLTGHSLAQEAQAPTWPAFSGADAYGLPHEVSW